MGLHLEALALLQRVWAALGALTSTALLLLAAATQTAVSRQELVGIASGPVWVLTACGALLALGAIGAFAAAGGLTRRAPSGRAVALALAIPNLLVIPFGTALGIYTFWVLLNNDARREFGRPLRGSVDGRR